MSAAQFTYLAKLDMDAVEQAQVDAISNYADLWVQGLAPNQPIRMNGDTLHPELGQGTFPSGRRGLESHPVAVRRAWGSGGATSPQEMPCFESVNCRKG